MEIKQIDNLSNNEYHNSEKYKEYWSSSNLKVYLETPREAYYQKYLAEKKEDSEAMIFGNQLHDFLASKHCKGQPFEWNIFEPPINSKGKPFGKTSDTYKNAASEVVNPITPDDMELINDIWSMIMQSDYAWFFEQEILGKGIAEPSYFIELGIHKYKIRLDVNNNKILDYKTITKKTGFNSNWTENKLKKRIEDLEYDISAAMYQYFEHKRTGIWKPFYIIWIMKDPPFDILISDISQYCFEPYGKDNEVIVNSGANVFLKLKDQHEACQAVEHWPGLANQFDEWNGLRIPKFSPRYDRGYDEFELETKFN